MERTPISPERLNEIMEEEYQAMMKNNPERNSAHPVEDFVIENFMDRVTRNREVNPYDIIAHFFFNHK